MSGERAAGYSRSARDVWGSLANRMRIAAKDRSEARGAAKAKAAGPSVQERQEELVRFYEEYEGLVEIVCDAAQYGPTSALDRRYAERRESVRRDYPALRPYLAGFLRFSEEDECNGLPADAFEALVAAEDLSEFLRADDGRMIGRITRTREALNLYGEHLRQLVARTQ